MPETQPITISTELLEEIFHSATNLHDDRPVWVHEIVRKGLTETAAQAPDWRDGGCLLSDSGDFILHLTRTLARIADLLINGEHVGIYTMDEIQQMSDQDDFSNLHRIDYMTKKHSALKSGSPYNC